MSIRTGSLAPEQQSEYPSPISISPSGTTAVPGSPATSHTCCTECTQTPYDKIEDPEDDPTLPPVHGWPELAKLISHHPGFEAFQAFRDLNVKSLLYYQAELADLRKDLHKVEWEDHRRGVDRAEGLCRRVDWLLLSEFDKNKQAQEQMRLMRRIREVLKEYSTSRHISGKDMAAC